RRSAGNDGAIACHNEAMTPRESATEALHTSGYRLTMQRQLVWDTLRHSKKHMSADDILGSVRRQYPRFNLATVYRSLEVLEELGLVKETRIRDRAYYELAEEEKRGVGRWLRHAILGGRDGLVNVLGLVLGVAAAPARLRIIVAAALAATRSDSIAMGGVM